MSSSTIVGGGILGDKELFAVIPGGSSTPVLRADEKVHAPDEKSPIHQWHGRERFGCSARRRHVPQLMGTMLGTCCVTVMAEGTCPVLAMQNLMRFYRHESCGQCTPCREGSAWLFPHRRQSFGWQSKRWAELDELHDIANNIMGNTICAFGEGTAMPALAFLKKYRSHFEDYVNGKRKRADATLLVTLCAGRRGHARKHAIARAGHQRLVMSHVQMMSQVRNQMRNQQ